MISLDESLAKLSRRRYADGRPLLEDAHVHPWLHLTPLGRTLQDVANSDHPLAPMAYAALTSHLPVGRAGLTITTPDVVSKARENPGPPNPAQFAVLADQYELGSDQKRHMDRVVSDLEWDHKVWPHVQEAAKSRQIDRAVRNGYDRPEYADYGRRVSKQEWRADQQRAANDVFMAHAAAHARRSPWSGSGAKEASELLRKHAPEDQAEVSRALNRVAHGLGFYTPGSRIYHGDTRPI